MGQLAQYHFGHLPVWVDGNAYLNGADISKHDTNYIAPEASDVYCDLVEEDGALVLKTNIFDLIGDFRTGVITSDTLGKAFEPEQRFEEPDGTTIVFNTDYFGAHAGVSVIPGPFAEGGASIRVL